MIFLIQLPRPRCRLLVEHLKVRHSNGHYPFLSVLRYLLPLVVLSFSISPFAINIRNSSCILYVQYICKINAFIPLSGLHMFKYDIRMLPCLDRNGFFGAFLKRRYIIIYGRMRMLLFGHNISGKRFANHLTNTTVNRYNIDRR